MLEDILQTEQIPMTKVTSTTLVAINNQYLSLDLYTANRLQHYGTNM